MKPVMQCLSGQFFDGIRNQCISCTVVCPPNKVPDNYCDFNCPNIIPKQSADELIGPKDVPTFFNINILFATIIPIIALLMVCFGIWMKRRHGRRAVSNVEPSVEPSVSIEMEPIGYLLSSPSSNEEPESDTTRIGGDPEVNADHTATQLLPS